MDPSILADSWKFSHSLDDVEFALPKEPEVLELPDGSGRVVLSDEFGDAFGVLEGDPQHLGFAFGRALDLLYGTEWDTASAPQIDPESGHAEFTGFGEQYLGCWQQRGAAWLFAVVRPERQPLAKAFIEGASIKL